MHCQKDIKATMDGVELQIEGKAVESIRWRWVRSQGMQTTSERRKIRSKHDSKHHHGMEGEECGGDRLWQWKYIMKMTKN